MPSKVRDVARQFTLGDATLEELREVAREAKGIDRQMADEILVVIATWEATAWTDSARAKGELRARVGKVAPPPAPRAPSSEDATMAMYGPGLRGQKRRG
jgi:hypothetical protein